MDLEKFELYNSVAYNLNSVTQIIGYNDIVCKHEYS